MCKRSQLEIFLGSFSFFHKNMHTHTFLPAQTFGGLTNLPVLELVNKQVLDTNVEWVTSGSIFALPNCTFEMHLATCPMHHNCHRELRRIMTNNNYPLKPSKFKYYIERSIHTFKPEDKREKSIISYFFLCFLQLKKPSVKLVQGKLTEGWTRSSISKSLLKISLF